MPSLLIQSFYPKRQLYNQILKNKPAVMKKENSSKMSRRDFVGGTIKSAAAFTIVPSTVISGLGYTAPSDKLNIVGDRKSTRLNSSHYS